MAQSPRPDDLAQLRARLDIQEAEIARLKRRRIPRRFLPVALVGLLVALLPLSILAAGPFGDLNPGRDAANADIQAIADAGITKGCNPPNFTAYCPNDLVTREQMASFLARTAGLGDNAPVANAKTAQTAGSATTAQTATNASNANTVSGYAPNGLARVSRMGVATTLTLTGVEATYGPALLLVAPGPGFILVTGGVVLGGSATCPCVTYARVRHLESGLFSPDSGPSVGASMTDYSDATFGWVFPVAAGTNTFDLRVRRSATGTATPQAYSGQLAALFVPFGSTGAGTLGTDEPAPANGGKP